MNGFYTWSGRAFLVLAPFLFAYRLIDDWQHPEVWDQDWQRDPRLYLPYGAAVAVCALAVFIYIYRGAQRTARLEARLAAQWNILEFIRQRQDAGDWEAAARATRYYEQVAGRPLTACRGDQGREVKP